MALYLVASIPLFFLFLRETIYAVQSNSSTTALIKGLLSFIPVIVLDLILKGIVPLHLTAWGLTLYHLYSDLLLWTILGCGCFFLFRISRNNSSDDFLYLLPVFLCGVFMPVPVFDLIRNAKEPTIYSLFLMPYMRIAIILSLAWFGDKFMSSGRSLAKILVAAGFVLSLGALTMGMYLYFYNLEAYGILCVFLVGLIVVMLYLSETRREHIWKIPLIYQLLSKIKDF